MFFTSFLTILVSFLLLGFRIVQLFLSDHFIVLFLKLLEISDHVGLLDQPSHEAHEIDISLRSFALNQILAPHRCQAQKLFFTCQNVQQKEKGFELHLREEKQTADFFFSLEMLVQVPRGGA